MSAGSILWQVVFFVGVVCVLILSLLPEPMLPPVDTGWDKSNHGLAFLVLGLLGFLGWPRRAPLVIVGLVVFGGAIEVLQSLSGYRSAEWLDLLADAVGLLGALLVFGAVRLSVLRRARGHHRVTGSR